MCGYNHLKNGFLRATANTMTLDQASKLENALIEYKRTSSKLLDDTIKSERQIYKKQISDIKTDLQELQNLVNTLKNGLKEQLIKFCASEISSGKIQSALDHFILLNYKNNEALFKIIEKTYNYKQQKDVKNIVAFISSLQLHSYNKTEGFQKLYEILKYDDENFDPNIFILKNEVENLPDTVPLMVNFKNQVRLVNERILELWASNIRRSNTGHIKAFSLIENKIFENMILDLIQTSYDEEITNFEKFVYLEDRAIGFVSLYNTMDENNDLETTELLTLATYIRKLIDTSELPESHRNKLTTIKYRLKYSVRNLIWSSRTKCTIKNVKYSEYLYTASEWRDYWAYTWVPGVEDVDTYWELDDIMCNGKYFTIKNTYEKRFLYCLADKYNDQRREVATSSSSSRYQSHWILTPQGDNFLLLNRYFYDYLYADYNQRDMDRRYVFSWIPSNASKKPYADILPIQSGGQNFVCIRQDRQFMIYQYDASSDTWQHYWTELIFQEEGDYDLKKYPWLVVDNLITINSVILLRHPEGIKIYQLDLVKPGLKLLKVDLKFNELFSGTFLWGNFYHDKNYVGIMTRDANKKIKFFASTLRPNAAPFSPLKIKVPHSSWNSTEVDFFVTNLKRENPEVIGLRFKDRLEFFRFNTDYALEKEFVTSKITKNGNDKLFFGKFTNDFYQDILQLNSSGLFTFQYNTSKNDYNFLHHHTEFKQAHGWSLDNWDSIHLVDLNGDNLDDLLFSSVQGITALNFDATSFQWRPFLKTDNLAEAQRFGSILKGFAPMPPKIAHSSIFIQDSYGELKWIKTNILNSKNSTIQITSTSKPHSLKSTHISIPQVHHIDNSTHKQLSRNFLSEKPEQRWIEQWNTNFLNDAVDPASGKVRLSIPLIDFFPSTGWKLDFILFYQSHSITSDILGVGWTLPLAQDYIFVDYQGSVYPENAQYYLVKEGQLHILEYKNQVHQTKNFKLADLDEIHQISYYTLNQSWIIESEIEETTYGTTDDALLRSLSWPNWRGIGRNKEQQEPLITAWYLTKRVDKINDRKLHYNYENKKTKLENGKYYDDSIWLKSISDDQFMKLTFDYGRKEISEYTLFNPEDEEGYLSFPTPLLKSHYLQSLSLTTGTYSQTLKFSYETNNGKRLLISIYQQLKSSTEQLLHFSYDTSLESQPMESCTLLPKELSVLFNYQTLTPPTPKVIKSYPIHEIPKIAYGSDYAIYGFQDVNSKINQVILRIMNRTMNSVVADCLFDDAISCPSAESDIKDFSIQAFHDWFLVLIETTKTREIHLYSRQKTTWSKKSKKIKFSKKALMRLSENLIVVAELNTSNLIIYKRNDNVWNETKITISNDIKALAFHKNLIVIYDESHLWLVRPDGHGSWEKQDIENVSNNLLRVLNLFDLTIESRNEIENYFHQNSLQILHNFIVLNILQEVNGQIYSHQDFRARTDSRVETYISELTKSEDWKPFLRKSLFLNFQSIHVQISDRGVNVGNETLYRMTGTEWEHETIPKKPKNSFLLGNHFVLQSDNHNHTVFKLYSQDSNKMLKGLPLKTLKLKASNQILNQYPAYIAYNTDSNAVKVLVFNDEKTLGQTFDFNNESLISGISYVSSSSKIQECRIRSVSALLPAKTEIYVDEVTLQTRNIQRKIAYQHAFESDNASSSYTETVSIIPGGKKNLYGWQEIKRSYQKGNVTRTELWYNSDGLQVLKPPKEKSGNEISQVSNREKNNMLLLDKNDNWLISDFSPYSLEDQMVGYYGFEPYESNQIDKTTQWQINNAKILKGKFPLTGEHYLQLKGSSSFLEGTFEPRNQDISYIAACWIRLNSTYNTNMPLLRGIINTAEGEKIIGLKAKVQHKANNWFYFELLINFQVIKQIYEDYLTYKTTTYKSIEFFSPDEVKFKITLRVEAFDSQIIDLDHIRFTPITHDFQAAVYHPLIGKPTAIIQNNGLILRNIYNHLQKEIANMDEKGQIEQFTSTSRSGYLMPKPNGTKIGSKPNVIVFEPESGYYETFDANSLQKNWKVDNLHLWSSALGQLWHERSETNQLRANTDIFDRTSAALRFYYTLTEPQSAITLDWPEISSLKLSRVSDYAKVLLQNDLIISPAPTTAELIVMLDKNFIWLWINSVLILDQELKTDSKLPWSSFTINVRGKVLIQDCLLLNRPQVTVKYFNAFGEKSQVIQLEDAHTVQVNEILHDELGREAIHTKRTRITRKAGEALLAYRENFVTNKDFTNRFSVWQTGLIRGELNDLNPTDEGFPYTRTEFAKNPLNQEQSLGLPGPEFSINGQYNTYISFDSKIAFLENLFPKHHGFHQKVGKTSNGSLKVHIFDQHSNEVAKYVHVSGFDHLLSTYEYDVENRLIKILPPIYHENVDTFRKTTVWKFGEAHLTSEEKKWQKLTSTKFIYDRNGRLKRKITPESGTTEYLYNSYGQKRFMVSLDETNYPQNIVYFNYDVNNQLIGTGFMQNLVSLQILHQLKDSYNLPHAQEYQTIVHYDDHFDPLLRGRNKQFITTNNDETVIEKLQFDAQQQVVYKRTIMKQSETDLLTTIKKYYVRNKVRKLTFLMKMQNKSLELVYSYSRLGQLIGLGTNTDPYYYARFDYYGSGQLATEQYQPGKQHSFTRHYKYNSPGFLKEIQDPYLTETVFYTSNGYGQEGYGDGMVMQTTFNASWPIQADPRWFKIQKSDLTGNYSLVCIKALKENGYLTDFNEPIKLYVRQAEKDMPLVCGGKTGNQLSDLIAKKQRPTYYGHRYAYGNHKELVKAKYFTEKTKNFTDPPQPHSFSYQISGLSKDQSLDIWNILTKSRFIITDQHRNDSNTAVGKRGDSFFRYNELFDDLAALEKSYVLYAKPIEQIVISAISEEKTLSLNDFAKAFLKWQDIDLTSSRMIYVWQKEIALKIGRMCIDKGYLPTNPNEFLRPLRKDFTSNLHRYTAFIPRIIKILSFHFAHELGETAFDFDSYKIDANGNHHLFNSGFKRYEFNYGNTANQVQHLRINDGLKEEGYKFDMKYDYQGNVIQALHKNIKYIEYHPVSQRTTRIYLTDGRKIDFHYDSQAAYDYLPYGELMRVFGNDPQSHIMFRFTGQEFDEETGLYNYHARLYDPSIGRFFQMDPKAQYFSPYVYSGNSPISVVDPDGEFALLLTCAVLGLIGMYAGGAAANNRWNPVEWDFKDSSTFLGMAGGAFAGVFLPLGFGASVGAIGGLMGTAAAGAGVLGTSLTAIGLTVGVSGTVGLGIGISYLSTAAVNQNWDPSKWKWEQPNTWNALFQGFTSGSGIAGGIAIAHNFANTGKGIMFLSNLKVLNSMGIGQGTVKGIFLSISYTTGISIAYVKGSAINNKIAFWEWDWSNPATWSGIVDGFDTGMGWPQNILEMGHGAKSILNNPKKYLFSGQKQFKLKSVLKDPKHPLNKITTSVVMAYFMGSSANENFDVSKWNVNVFSTYEGVLNGVFFGKDISKTLKYLDGFKVKVDSNTLTNKPKISDNILSRNIQHAIDLIQKYQVKMNLAFDGRLKLLSKISNDGLGIRQKIELFFKKDSKGLKNGENRMPQELQQLIHKETQAEIQKNSDVAAVKMENEELLKKQQEVNPDENLAYVKCDSYKRMKRSFNQNSKPFYFETIEEQFTDDPRRFKIKVSINGNELEEKTTNEVYEYIKAEHSDLMMPDKNQFLAEHRKMLANDFVMIGFHGTNEIAALSIMLNKEFEPSSDFGKNTHWIGVYAAENLKLSLEGYANDIEDTSMKRHSRVLAVYAKKEDVKNIGLTLDDFRTTFGNEGDGLVEPGPGFGLTDKKITQSILAGKDSGFNLNEMVIKMGIGLKATVLPIITENDFNSVLKYFSLEDVTEKVLQNIAKLPSLEEIKSIRDLSPNDKRNLQNIIKMDDAPDLKSTLNLLNDKYLGQEGIEDVLKIKNSIQELNNLRYNNGDYDDNEQEVIRKIFEKDELNQLILELELFKDTLGQDEFSLENKKQLDNTLSQLKDLSVENKKIVEALLKNQGFGDLSQKNKKVIETVLKIKNVQKFDSNRKLLDQLSLSTSLENIIKSLDTTKINDIFTLLKDDERTLDKKKTLENIFKIQDALTVPDNFEEIKMLLNVKYLSAGDFYDLEDYFLRQNNPVIAVEHFKVLSEFLNFKGLTDNDLHKAKKLLNINNLSSEGFLALRDFQPLKDILEFKHLSENDFESARDLQPLEFKKVLLFEEHNLKEVKYLIEPKPIPLKSALHHALKEFEAEKHYFCSKRSKRSIMEKTTEINLQNCTTRENKISFYSSFYPTPSAYLPEAQKSVPSSANLLTPWTKRVLKLGEKILSNIFSYTNSEVPENSLKPKITCNPLHTSLPEHSRFFGDDPQNPEFTKTILDIGDHWTKTTDLNGLLSWATILARKLTGYRPKCFQNSTFDPSTQIQLDIQSYEIVNAFIEMVQKHSQRFAMQKLYSEAIKLVRNHLASNKIDEISISLFKHIIKQNISIITLNFTQTHVGQFLDNILNELPKFEQELLKNTFINLSEDSLEQCSPVDQFGLERNLNTKDNNNVSNLERLDAKQSTHIK
uniref:CSON001661 protein n=1 Tax=Culicoides sonorensis TaxID=179676 RepID=A0A336KYX1_CULSO